MSTHLSIDMILSLVDRISGPLKHITKGVTGVGDAAEKTARKFTRIQNEVDKIARHMKKLDGLGRPLAAVGAVGAAGIGLTVKAYADLEESQTRMKINLMDTAGKVGPEFAKLNKLAERLGTALPGSTEDMNEMFTALLENGISAKQVLGGVGEATAKFAIIMGQTPKEIAPSVAQISVAMGIAEKDTVSFVDTLQRLKSAAGVNVLDMTNTLTYSGAALKALRIQGVQAGQDVAAAIGLMKRSAIDGSVAGTSMSMAFTRMAEVNSRLNRGMVKQLVGPILDKKGIQLKFFTASGDFVGIRGMIAELEKLRAVNPQEQLLVLSRLFGQEAAKPLSVFVSQGVKGFDEMNARLKAQASLQLKIDEIMKTSKESWSSMSGTAQNLLAHIGGAFTKIVSLPALFNKLNDLFGRMDSWVLANPKTAGAIGAVVASLTGIALVGGGALLAIAGIGSAIGPFLGGLSALVRVFGMLSGGIRAALIGFRVLSMFMVTNPIGLTITGIAIAAFLIYKYWGPITQFFTRIWKSVANIAGKMKEAGANLINMLWQGIKSMAMKPVEAIKAIAQKIRNHLPFSPAKEGPLRDIHRIRLVETIAETIKPGPMASAMSRAVNMTMQVASSAPGRTYAAGNGAGMTVNLHNTVNVAAGNGPGIREEVERSLSQSVHDFERMMTRVMQQQQRRKF